MRLPAASLLLQLVFIIVASSALQETSQREPSKEAPRGVEAGNGTTPAAEATTNTTTTNSDTKLDGGPKLLVETLPERLLKESKLQAEESRHETQQVSVLPAPLETNLTGAAEQERPSRQLVRKVASYYSPSSFSGGSGNSYMSISRDGSNRYEFGFDTERRATGSQVAGEQSSSASRKQEPRLMREETRLEDGTVVGRYGYTDPFKVFRIVQYVAGPEGYFASEDVEAMNSAASELDNQPARFQLNKQLHKRLEEARRLRAKRKSSASRVELEEEQESRAGAASLPRALVQREPEVLASSATHSEYATRVNHVVGANGVSYATAFRPVTPREISGLAYQPVQAQPSEALQRQHQEWEERRSRLPAPIYKPSMGYGGPSGEQPSTRSALEASPAWSLLNNNYQQQTSSIFVDHLGPPEATMQGHLAYQRLPVAQTLGKGIEENFRREAAVLQSLRRPQQVVARPPARQSMAYNYNQDQPADFRAPARHQGGHFGEKALWQQAQKNYATLTLNHFDPPLYSPEVHEESRAGEPQPVLYSSMVIHPEAEWPDQRDLARASSSESKSLASSAAKAVLLESVGRRKQKFNVEAQESDTQQEIEGRGKALIVDHSSLERVEAEAKGSPGIETSEMRAEGSRPLEPKQVPPVREIKYATRLSGQRLAAEEAPEGEHADLTVEDSEQVSSAVLNNGAPRARIPDRNKKLSSIFKARQPAKKFGRLVPGSALVESQSEQSGTEPPVAAAKKRPNLREFSSSSTTTSTPAPPSEQPERKQVEISAESQPADSASSTLVVDSGASKMDSELYKKIVRVQKEIEAKRNQSELSLASSVSSTTTSSQLHLEAISTESDLAARAELVSKREGALEHAASNSSLPIENKLDSREESKLVNSTDLEQPSASSGSEVSANEIRTNSVLTGPLMKMDSSMDNADFLNNLSKDMDLFDSLRSWPSERQPNSTDNFPSPTPPSLKLEAPQAEVASTILPTESSQQLAKGKRLKLKVRVNKSELNNTSSGELAPEKPKMDQEQLEVRRDILSSQAHQPVPQTVSQFSDLARSPQQPVLQPVSQISESAQGSFQQPVSQLNEAARSPQQPVLQPVSQVNDLAQGLSNQPVAQLADASRGSVQSVLQASEPAVQAASQVEELAPSPQQPVLQPVSQVSETARSPQQPVPQPVSQLGESDQSSQLNKTSETISESIVSEKPTRFRAPEGSQSSEKAQKARLGYMVIKNSGKVVARFNGSEPIPDNLIPVTGNGTDMIVPDMPRRGMRIAMRRRAQQPSPSPTSTTTTSAPSVSPQSSEPSIPSSPPPKSAAEGSAEATLKPVALETEVASDQRKHVNGTSSGESSNDARPT